MTLSSRISSLTGPDRAVDAEVAVALGYRRDGNMFRTEREDFVLERDYYDIEGSARELPRFTSSLDAVASIEEGWTEIECYAPNCEYELFTFYGRDEAGVQHQGLGATECLARLTAAMQARGL